MVRLKNKEKMLTTGIVTLLGIFLFALISCKSPYSPDDFRANIIASNTCGVAVDVFMDGNFQFSVEDSSYGVIENVKQGVYNCVANKKGTEELVSSISIDIVGSGDYVWTIQSSASIKVTNEYGQTLSIYYDGYYQGDLEDQESQSISNVPYGEHQLDAVRTSDGTEVDSTAIDIVENKEYSWTIRN